MTRELNRIGGSALGARIPTVSDHVDEELQSFDDLVQSPKYPRPGIHYFARGSLSVDPRGSFVIADAGDTPGPGILRGDKQSSSLYSTSSKTTLGSTDVDTVHGDILNPAGTKIPSSHMTPQKTWLKSLLPTLSIRDVSLIAIAGILQTELRVSVSAPKAQTEPGVRNFDVADLVKRRKDELLRR